MVRIALKKSIMNVISLIRSNCLGMRTAAGGTSGTSSRVFSSFSLVISLTVLHLTLITELILPPGIGIMILIIPYAFASVIKQLQMEEEIAR